MILIDSDGRYQSEMPGSHCVVDAHLEGVVVPAQTGAVHPDSH